VLNWEVRPPADWDKGSAAAWLRDRQSPPGALAFFLGDDHTDEDAFRVLPGGVTVLVGPVRETAAAYHAPDPTAVVDFLRRLADL
jgi:trehalose 6-phosphate phosphatase